MLMTLSWLPSVNDSDALVRISGGQPRRVDVEQDMEVDREDGNYTSSTGTPGSDSGRRPGMIPVPDSPLRSVQLPSQRVPSNGHHHLESSFDKMCEPFQAPRAGRSQNDELTWGQLRDQRSQRGFRKEASKAVLKTRLATVDAAEAKRNLKEVTQEDGGCERAPAR